MKVKRSNKSIGSFHLPRPRKGQALLELAVLGVLLGMLLAGVVDLGRAYYTAVIVENMAGEGASYLANAPEKDSDYPAAGDCSQFVVANSNDYAQNRIRQVAIDRGLVHPGTVSLQLSPVCSDRCVGTSVGVTVTYQISDLFLPKLVGLSSITIKKSAFQLIRYKAYGATCP